MKAPHHGERNLARHGRITPLPADEVALVERLRMAVNVRARLERDTPSHAGGTRLRQLARSFEAQDEAISALLLALTEDA